MRIGSSAYANCAGHMKRLSHIKQKHTRRLCHAEEAHGGDSMRTFDCKMSGNVLQSTAHAAAEAGITSQRTL